MGQSGVLRPIGFRAEEISLRINRGVVEQHASEAAFLWTQRDRAVFAPHYTLKDLAALDERVEAHVDGLRVAGPAGWEVARETLADAGPGETFAGSLLAFESGDAERIALALEVGCSKAESARGLTSALGWMPFEQARPYLEKLVTHDRPEVRSAGIAGFAAHGQHPGMAIAKALADANSGLRAAALYALGRLGDAEHHGPLASELAAQDEACRFFAAWSAARLGDHTRTTVRVLQQIAQESALYAQLALDMALRCMNLSEAKYWQAELRKSAEGIRLSVLGAGVIGDPECVEDLIALMADKALARVAGEAFSMITGADLGHEDLDGDAPEDFPQSPSDEPDEEEVGLDPDGSLPWPVQKRVAAWWQKRKGDYSLGVRYLCGNEITAVSLTQTLVQGRQRQRAAAALELGLRKPSSPLFEIRERGDRQLWRVKVWSS